MKTIRKIKKLVLIVILSLPFIVLAAIGWITVQVNCYAPSDPAIVIDQPSLNLFLDSYDLSRDAFRKKALSLKEKYGDVAISAIPVPGKADNDLLEEACGFGRDVARRLAGKKYQAPSYDASPSALHRLERFLANRLITEHVYSRLFRTNAGTCTACGMCRKVCPTGNITENRDGTPRWGRNCLLCLYCEMKCPSGAITSPVSWPVFRPFLERNVRSAARDGGLDYAKVTHEKGKTLRTTSA